MASQYDCRYTVRLYLSQMRPAWLRPPRCPYKVRRSGHSGTAIGPLQHAAAWRALCRDSQLSQVLERGSGSAAALAILYMEVCQRMGLPMAARLLDGGRYVVLWPTDAPLRTCGQQFVVDAYSQGEPFLLAEVCLLPGSAWQDDNHPPYAADTAVKAWHV